MRGDAPANGVDIAEAAARSTQSETALPSEEVEGDDGPVGGGELHFEALYGKMWTEVMGRR